MPEEPKGELSFQDTEQQFERNLEGLNQRAEQVNGVTKEYASGALVHGGEGTAARFLGMHEKLNKLYSGQFKVREGDITPYMSAVYETIATLCDGLTNSTQPDAMDAVRREQAIASKGPELAEEIRKAVEKVGGSVGPRTPIQLEERRIVAKRPGPIK